jgi:hypothetical protein
MPAASRPAGWAWLALAVLLGAAAMLAVIAHDRWRARRGGRVPRWPLSPSPLVVFGGVILADSRFPAAFGVVAWLGSAGALLATLLVVLLLAPGWLGAPRRFAAGRRPWQPRA